MVGSTTKVDKSTGTGKTTSTIVKGKPYPVVSTSYSQSLCPTTTYKPITTSVVKSKEECQTKSKGYGGY